MDKTLRALQMRLKRERGGSHWRTPPDLKAQIVAWVAEARRAGTSWINIKVALGVTQAQVARWQRQTVSTAQVLRPVHVVDDPAATNTTTATSSLKVTVVEGLSVADVAKLFGVRAP